MNLTRYLNKVHTNAITVTLGLIAIMLAGSAYLLRWQGIHLELPLFPVLLVGVGVLMLVNVIFRKEENNDAA